VALTVLLPLKGRHLHTLRFLWHAERERLPYRFLIADGQVEPVMADLLERSADLFPHLAIDYVRFPDDRSYGDYFRKMAAACARVRTPYVMQADNDDFLLRSGIDRCMGFLETHADYASCGGGVGGFALHDSAAALSHVTGAIRSLGSQYHGAYVHQDFASISALARVRRDFATGYTLFYNVFRTPALATIRDECAALDFKDLRAHETFFGALAKSLGKSRLDRGVMSYFRQAGTSQAAARMWDETVAPSVAEAEIAAFTERIAQAVAVADGVEVAPVAAELRQRYQDIWRQELEAHNGAAVEAVKADWLDTLRAMTPAPLIAWRRRFLRRRARAAIAASLCEHGARDDDVSQFAQELSRIEAVLEGPDFAAFVQRHAPALLAAPTR
jgi:glycosyltransferase domain-containing protein